MYKILGAKSQYRNAPEKISLVSYPPDTATTPMSITG